ncbi:hypothetical protein BJ165DRAFT_1406315 [Panaeolus papilionaceus]|nr:hypothetical protein BJ165DRAFT_1406315 [Panaeolus papilionaceus]
MSAPAPELPIEIWEQILSYLPNTFTATLYAINSPLLHLALNLRYRVATIDGSAIERSLLSSNARGRARKVIIKTNHDYCFEPSCNLNHALKNKNLLKRIRLPLLGKHLFTRKGTDLADGGGVIRRDTYHDQLMQAIQDLNHVQEVGLRCLSMQEEHYLSKLKFTKALLGASLDHISRLA